MFITKLSILLKVLEGDTGEIAQRDFLKERERILPHLANNIKCGNSLIGPDFYDQPGLPEMDIEDYLRITSSTGMVKLEGVLRDFAGRGNGGHDRRSLWKEPLPNPRSGTG